MWSMRDIWFIIVVGVWVMVIVNCGRVTSGRWVDGGGIDE